MGLPIAAVQVGIADRVATMEHPAVAHIDAHMRNARCIIGADKEHQITGVPKKLLSSKSLPDERTI